MAQITEHHQHINSLVSHPAHLFIGPRDAIIGTVIEHLQKILCSRAGCYTCITCRQIAQSTHHSLLWLSTETHYTLEDIQSIHDTVRFALDPDAHFFIVIEHAERLNAASANSLLTTLEEPPAGYHFMLLVERSEQLLATIRSRCVVQLHDTMSQSTITHPLLLFLTSTTAPDLLSFLQELESTAPSEQETAKLLDALIRHWHEQYRIGISTQKNDLEFIEKALALCTSALKKLPMPGSSKIFWKNIALQFIALF